MSTAQGRRPRQGRRGSQGAARDPRDSRQGRRRAVSRPPNAPQHRLPPPRPSCDAKLEALGWQPRTSWEEGLRATVEWYCTHDAAAWWDNGAPDAAGAACALREREASVPPPACGRAANLESALKPHPTATAAYFLSHAPEDE